MKPPEPFLQVCREIGFQIDLFLAVVRRLGSVHARRTLILDQFYQSGIKVVHVVLFGGGYVRQTAAAVSHALRAG